MFDFNTYPYCEHRQYSTGDQVWLMHDDITPQSMVVSLLTHDGIFWSEGMPSISTLTGLAMLKHRLSMFWFKFKQNL